jgi:hypothetical protein
MKIYEKLHPSLDAASVDISKLEKKGFHVRKTYYKNGDVLLQYAILDDSLVGKTILVLKPCQIIQETEESNGEYRVINPKTQLVIFFVSKSSGYIYAKNEIANKEDHVIIGNYRYPVNKRKFIIGKNEFIDLIQRKLIKIK